ncbi:GH116 family glycosyl-hydrolase [Acidaminobacter sp. JC074]|uniref:GH116 family glycosyl-hydrolase n=1 Tax=Acidaminobacter sp. JC074 TaxID=2530199 RepID=UPI001F1187B3|nr:GH116 family glycosyl-hydrolase [Acidaminobacter sp. JC074]
MKNKTFSRDVLFDSYVKKAYKPEHTQAAFLLGGIGTGNISIGSRGEFRDWEIYNSPGKGNTSNYTFFTIRTKEESKEPKLRVLESALRPPYLNMSIGYSAEKYAGLPRFKDSKMTSEYPFVNVEFEDSEMPVQVSMEAFTPFIPLNPDDSGIPGAIIRYKVKNVSNKTQEVSIAGSLTNSMGFVRNSIWGFMDTVGETFNEKCSKGNLTGVFMGSKNIDKKSVKYGNLSIMTSEKNVSCRPEWNHDAWWDGIHDYWEDLSHDGHLNEDSAKIGLATQLGHKTHKVGAICVNKTLNAGEEENFEFLITWYLPNRPDEWSVDVYDMDVNSMDTTQNHYATLFEDSWHVGEYIISNMKRLEEESRMFTNALYSSTLPSYVLDAIASNITVIRSTTCFRIKGGAFMAWEGSHDQFGSCHGTCTHVWNYAQTLAFLFPSLERSARKTEFLLETDDSGKMNFRTDKLFNKPFHWDFQVHPAADGQMGSIIRAFREWKLSGDDDFIRTLWPKIKLAMDYAFTHWDKDGDYVLDSQQHNTYDIEFYGPNSLVNSMFYGALKACTEIAKYLSDDEGYNKYSIAFETGHEEMHKLLWDEEYYIQRIDDVNRYKYQYGSGCLSDQLFGQTMAHIAGLGYVLPKDHVKKAVKSIFDYNFMTSMENHVNVQRTYALNDEAGLLLCTWPKGGRPKLPFVYSDEVWTGIEYQVATHLIYEGYLEEGLTMAKACRDRYDGIKRNPWSEVECGHHYARSLASWGLLLSLSGYRYDLTKDSIEFNPSINQNNFKTFWSNGKAWGTYRQVLDEKGELNKKVEVLYQV